MVPNGVSELGLRGFEKTFREKEMQNQIFSEGGAPQITLSEALASAVKILPRKPRGGEVLMLDVALRATADLAEHNHPEDDQLLALLWLLPDDIAAHRTPGSMKTLLPKIRGVWAGILSALSEAHPEIETHLESTPFDAGDEPPVARVIAATYLRMLLESGAAESLRSSVKPVPEREAFYQSLLAVAEGLKKNSPDLSGDLLLEAVKRVIRAEGLKQKLLSGEVRDTIWTFALRPQVPAAEGEAALRSLRSFLTGFRLSAAVSMTEGRVEAVHLLAEEAKGETGEKGAAIERLAASLAVRFSKVFIVVRLQRKEVQGELMFHRAGITGWHMGLRYKGRHDQLLRSQEADPLTEFLQMEPSGGLKTQLEQIEKLSSN